MDRVVYRLIRPGEWVKGTSYFGTSKDQKDGFIHLSTKDQVKGTYEKYYSGKDAHLLVIDLDDVETYGTVKWEVAKSRQNEHFAHVYGPEGIRPSSIMDEIHVNNVCT